MNAVMSFHDQKSTQMKNNARPMPERVGASGGAGDAYNDNDEDDEETRRIEYLRRHRALLEQKRRLETERRVGEVVADNASIATRQAKVHDTKLRAQEEEAQAKKQLRPLASSQSLPSIGASHTNGSAAASSADVGTYTKFENLSTEELRVIAEKQTLRDMAPLNTRGKYHARYMKDVYPIAGTQLKMEKDRDMVLAAKKTLLLTKTTTAASGTNPMGQRGGRNAFGHLPYRKLDFHADKFISVLQTEETQARSADEQRRVRHATVQHREGLEQFWQLIHAQRYHEVIAWLKSHRFRDVNIPVIVRNAARVHQTKSPPLGTELVVEVEPNRDVGLTPLMAACRLHNTELVQAILDQGAVVYLRTANGDTAMHFLWRDWHDDKLTSIASATQAFVKADHTYQILKLLVDRQAVDVNAQNAFGESALQHCARLGLLDCVKLLLAHGGDAFATDRSGASAISYAKTHHHGEIVKILQNYEIVERTKAKERERRQTQALLNQKRGTLTANWSESPDKLLARLAVEERRAGHLRNQFIDRHGHVIECKEDDDDGDAR